MVSYAKFAILVSASHSVDSTFVVAYDCFRPKNACASRCAGQSELLAQLNITISKSHHGTHILPYHTHPYTHVGSLKAEKEMEEEGWEKKGNREYDAASPFSRSRTLQQGG